MEAASFLWSESRGSSLAPWRMWLHAINASVVWWKRRQKQREKEQLRKGICEDMLARKAEAFIAIVEYNHLYDSIVLGQMDYLENKKDSYCCYLSGLLQGR